MIDAQSFACFSSGDSAGRGFFFSTFGTGGSSFLRLLAGLQQHEDGSKAK